MKAKKCTSPKAMKKHVKEDMKDMHSMMKADKKLMQKMPKMKHAARGK